MAKLSKKDDLITVRDLWGKRHRVPRRFFPSPHRNTTVINLAGKNSGRIIEKLALATGKEADLAAGIFVLRDGDMNSIARMAMLFEETERPKRRSALRRQRAWIEERIRKACQRAGQKKAGRLMPQTVLIRVAVRVLKRERQSTDVDTLCALLTGRHPRADLLLECVADEVNPIELPNDGPPADIEDGMVFFRFKNRSDRKMSVARLRNAASEAVRTKS